MKKIILITIFTLATQLINAQLKQIAEGPEFELPEGGYTKIFQLKNGNTVFINKSKDFSVRVYDKSYKEIAVNNLKLSNENLSMHSLWVHLPKKMILYYFYMIDLVKFR